MTTLGSRIKAYREQLGISQYEVAERCTSIDNRDKNNKWGQSRIANYERNNRTPDLDDIEILSKVLGVSPETLAFDTNVQLARPTKSNSYPLISNIQAGLWTEAFDFKDSEGYDYIDTEIDAGPDAFFLRISGMSMEPKFSEGDLVLIDIRKRPHPGDYVAAVNGTGEATLKRYRELGEWSESGNPHFELIPLNPDFPKLSSMKQDIRIIGVAVEHRSYL
ncbi:TPA: LexA family transcriptional regulator [Mannheimia haemolytica]|uniref:helix-turn-helix domain-containing protein n=1 Tax=Mannheimia haemolytica TaxID=75985 RepID=UPI00094AEB35|nr:XRE family transcriptional regulator [Mannheimia haemolytica]MDW0536516.1 XRE family transcriptional regulator [Mannheimia haemolytica]MDW0539125.1 XRE family transcriptional regulator [Mannheimia haemolytica]MDW1158746.1 XRE family transcriptional regulator [Mannheimia haemolytica]QEA91931.1 heme-binding protein [Mannheimia haemolytica]QEB43686.1 heme-binding protein [Mannheimia haemolytica]